MEWDSILQKTFKKIVTCLFNVVSKKLQLFEKIIEVLGKARYSSYILTTITYHYHNRLKQKHEKPVFFCLTRHYKDMQKYKMIPVF